MSSTEELRAPADIVTSGPLLKRPPSPSDAQSSPTTPTSPQRFAAFFTQRGIFGSRSSEKHLTRAKVASLERLATHDPCVSLSLHRFPYLHLLTRELHHALSGASLLIDTAANLSRSVDTLLATGFSPFAGAHSAFADATMRLGRRAEVKGLAIPTSAESDKPSALLLGDVLSLSSALRSLSSAETATANRLADFATTASQEIHTVESDANSFWTVKVRLRMRRTEILMPALTPTRLRACQVASLLSIHEETHAASVSKEAKLAKLMSLNIEKLGQPRCVPFASARRTRGMSTSTVT